jgi:hypothetical protein
VHTHALRLAPATLRDRYTELFLPRARDEEPSARRWLFKFSAAQTWPAGRPPTIIKRERTQTSAGAGATAASAFQESEMAFSRLLERNRRPPPQGSSLLSELCCLEPSSQSRRQTQPGCLKAPKDLPRVKRIAGRLGVQSCSNSPGLLGKTRMLLGYPCVSSGQLRTPRPWVRGRLPAGRGSAEQDAVHLQRSDRAAPGAPHGRSDCTNILRLDVGESLQRSAKLRAESGDLPGGRRNGTMRMVAQDAVRRSATSTPIQVLIPWQL